jgi:hypothetical protein
VIRFSPSASLLGGVCVVLLLGACAEPTSVSGGPLFVALEDVGGTRLDPFGALPPLPSDSCPRIPPLTAATARREVPGGNGMTIAVPDVPDLLTTDLRPERGVAFRISNQGLVIVTFDNKLPVIEFARGTAFRSLFNADQWRGHRACAAQIGGRSAMLYIDRRVETYRRVDDSGIVDTNVFIGNEMLVQIPEPDGSPTYITLIGRTPGGGTLGNQASVLGLLPIAASARW